MSLGKPPLKNRFASGFFSDLWRIDLEAVGGGRSRNGSSRKLFTLGLLFLRPYEANNLLFGNFMLTDPHCVSLSSDLFSLILESCGPLLSISFGLSCATNTGLCIGGFLV